MTIAAAYLTSEGVVLGGDSTTTIASSKGQTTQLINHAQKVFEVGESGRVAICTWGAGAIGHYSHRTIAALLGDFVAKNPNASTEDTAKELEALMSRLVQGGQAIHGGFLGYMVGGCDPVSREPKLLTVEFLSGQVTVKSHGIGPLIGGSHDYFARVFHGRDLALERALQADLKQRLASVPAADFDKAFADAVAAIAPKFAVAGWADLPIREAIDFVHTYLHITVKVEKFKSGLPACGGPIEIAFITTDRKFRWVRHKGFDSAIVEHQNLPR